MEKDGKGATWATRRDPALVGRSLPSSPGAQLYLEANCKQSDSELLPLPINYPAAWDAMGSATPPAPAGAERHTKGGDAAFPKLGGSPLTAPISAPLPLPSQQKRWFHRWLPWEHKMLPSEIAALIGNRAPRFAPAGKAQLELADQPHWGSCTPKSSPQPRWPHSILTADVLWSRGACPQHQLAQQREPS